jgi:hypothetical protein
MLSQIEKIVLAGSVAFQVSAMTVRDIPGIKENREDSVFVGMINLHAEAYLQSEAENPYFPISQDSVKTALYTYLSQLDEISSDRNSARHLLLKGLIWHYLYQLDVDSAFSMADRLASHAMKSYPDIPEAAWLKGINLIRATRIKKGFTILDSLRAGGLVQNKNFLLDYATLSALYFLPYNKHALSDSQIIFLSPASNVVHTGLREEENIPSSEKWQVYSRSSQQLKMPVFTFSGSYTLSQLLSLLPLSSVLLSSVPNSAPRLKMDIDERITKRFGPIPTPLVYDPEASKYPMEVKIIADCNKSGLSLPDYMGSIVRNRFNIIKETGDLRKLKAISLRCYNRSVFRNVPGEFCAFVTFDLKLSRNPSNSFHESKRTSPSEEDDAVIVRYLIAMKTSDAVEEKAEAIFHDLLYQFERL